MKKVIQQEAFGDNRIDPADAGVQTTWIAYTAFKEIVEALGDREVTAGTITGALDDGLEVGTGGLTPTLQWQFDNKLSSVGFPRLVNTDVTVQVVRDGRLVAARKGSLDTTETLRGAEVN